ncbi:MAG: hypothetical protein LC713_05990 [Actinobacteria bacterium]|nr:hypothetical protein [Actinomycetota bacterium]
MRDEDELIERARASRKETDELREEGARELGATEEPDDDSPDGDDDAAG